MLTGDKYETAVNIAQSCALISESTKPLVLSAEDHNTTLQKLTDFVTATSAENLPEANFAVIIDGNVRFPFNLFNMLTF